MRLFTFEPPLDPPEPEVALYCDCCGEPIYVGEDYYDLSDIYCKTGVDNVCSECITDCIDRHFKAQAEVPEPDYEED